MMLRGVRRTRLMALLSAQFGKCHVPEGGAMASADDVHIHHTPNGVRVNLGKLYLYPDGHANLTFPAAPGAGKAELNMPPTDELDVVDELLTLVRRMKHEVRTKKSEQTPKCEAG